MSLARGGGSGSSSEAVHARTHARSERANVKCVVGSRSYALLSFFLQQEERKKERIEQRASERFFLGRRMFEQRLIPTTKEHSFFSSSTFTQLISLAKAEANRGRISPSVSATKGQEEFAEKKESYLRHVTAKAEEGQQTIWFRLVLPSRQLKVNKRPWIS